MPSTSKTLYFMSSALATAIGIGILGYAMSQQWSYTTMKCARSESDLYNGSATIDLGLFKGLLKRESCPGFGSTDTFEVVPTLAEGEEVASLILHGLVVCLLVLCMVFSACSILISLYNSVSNPYETYMGPVGIYTCSSISACVSVVVLIIFVLNLNVTKMAEDLVTGFIPGISVVLLKESSEMKLGYYLVIPYTALSLLAIGLIYIYDHAAYTRRREQERPTEDAPKDIIMY
ncbi:clarin-3 [Cololabis saira]|uniref:clarin-3 n=1 Tax=Cololabis saira TaxID=129043 RepID=UPI002AD24A2D|nr:clarin-3 [Cololabis saira]